MRGTATNSHHKKAKADCCAGLASGEGLSLGFQDCWLGEIALYIRESPPDATKRARMGFFLYSGANGFVASGMRRIAGSPGPDVFASKKR
jgi:hypothetical protein